MPTAVVEEGHVKNISDMIKQFGGKPTAIGEIAAPITGKVAGGITSIAGVVNLLKADIALEKRQCQIIRIL